MKNNTSQNPNPLRKKLASRFLRAMKKLNNMSSSSPSMAEKGKRHHAVRAAAYASMASTVGPRRAWSRALLRNMRGGGRRRSRNPRKEGIRTRFGLKDLSEMVPGGEAMDSCSLLNETTHYIKCLRAQVHIMRQILHSSTSSSSSSKISL